MNNKESIESSDDSLYKNDMEDGIYVGIYNELRVEF